MSYHKRKTLKTLIPKSKITIEVQQRLNIVSSQCSIYLKAKIFKSLKFKEKDKRSKNTNGKT